MKEQYEHPGKSIYQSNKKLLRAKAEQELRENFKPIFDRKMRILETIMDVKNKIGEENKLKRINSAFPKTRVV